MKKLSVIPIILMVFALSINAQTGEISIKVTGIDVKKGGTLKLGVYKKEGFPSIGNQIAYKTVQVEREIINVEFKGIEPDIYAIAVFQDVDNNAVLSKNMFGMPIELYGFSKNIYGRGGPPLFEDVCFKLENGKKISLIINLK